MSLTYPSISFLSGALVELAFYNIEPHEAAHNELSHLDLHFLHSTRVAMVREKYLEMKFFPGKGKVREFCGWFGKFRKDLESLEKVRELENKWLWQSVFRTFIYLSVQEGKGCTFS